MVKQTVKVSWRGAEHLFAAGLGGSESVASRGCVVCAEWGIDSLGDWVGRFLFAGEYIKGGLCNDCAAIARGVSDPLGDSGLFGGLR